MQLLEVFNQLRTARPLSKDTLANYKRAVIYLSNHIGRDVLVSDLNPSLVNSWLTSCESHHDPRYVRSLRRDLLVVWNFAADNDYCQHPKTRLIRISKIPDKTPEAWPIDWIPKLMEASKHIKGNLRAKDCPRSWYVEAYLRTEIDLLCRPTDMRHLLWSQFDQDGSIWFVQHKTGKHHKARLQRETVRCINRLVSLDSTYIFPIGKTATEALIGKLFVLAGIVKPKGQSLGHLRHTGGTAIAAKHGNDAARKALGHTPHSRVFEKHYQDPSSTTASQPVKWW